MGDLVPYGTPEEAKTALEAVKIAAGLLGEAPGFQDAIGLMGFDRLRVTRLERMATLISDANARLEASGIRERITPSLSLELPLLTAAADENSEELGELWTRLLMAALNPKRANLVRKSFIEIVKKMDPLDALVFQRIDSQNYSPNARDFWARQLDRSSDEITVSLQNLARIGCVDDRKNHFEEQPTIYLTATGRLLKAALAD